MTERIYVDVRFNPWDRKTYRYAWTGDAPPAIGDDCIVIAKGEKARVKIESFDAVKPTSFECADARPLNASER